MPKGLKTLEFSFQDTALTHFGGLVLIQRFCQALALRRQLQRHVPVRQRRGDFHPADLMLALLFVQIAGLRRISKTQILQYTGAFWSWLAWAVSPNPRACGVFCIESNHGRFASLY